MSNLQKSHLMEAILPSGFPMILVDYLARLSRSANKILVVVVEYS